jgi:hypothetical protein
VRLLFALNTGIDQMFLARLNHVRHPIAWDRRAMRDSIANGATAS